MAKKSLRIWTSVWGDKHISWFEKYAISSLKSPRNAEALIGATWVINTREQDRERIAGLIKESGLKVKDTEFVIFSSEFDQNPHAAGSFINQALLREISMCLTYNAQTLICPPDTIWGDGSIEHLIEVADQRDVVVLAAHARVLPEIAAETGITNAGLVSLAWKSLHATWREAEYGRDRINTYVGGVIWRYLSEALYSVQHFLPTPYLINWTPEDLVYFKNQIHWGVWDHAWPDACLISTERQRVVGSSDAAFMVEVTEPEQNIPPLEHYRVDSPDLFWKNLSHNKHNRMFNIIFRGEPSKS